MEYHRWKITWTYRESAEEIDEKVKEDILVIISMICLNIVLLSFSDVGWFQNNQAFPPRLPSSSPLHVPPLRKAAPLLEQEEE